MSMASTTNSERVELTVYAGSEEKARFPFENAARAKILRMRVANVRCHGNWYDDLQTFSACAEGPSSGFGMSAAKIRDTAPEIRAVGSLNENPLSHSATDCASYWIA